MEKGNWKSIGLGMGIGGVNALFGGGGGMLAVPALRLLGLQEKQAHATAIAVILPVSLLSFLWYFIAGLYDVNVLIPTAIGTVLGGLLGAKTLQFLPQKATQYVFAALQALAGFWLLFAP